MDKVVVEFQRTVRLSTVDIVVSGKLNEGTPKHNQGYKVSYVPFTRFGKNTKKVWFVLKEIHQQERLAKLDHFLVD